MYLITVVTVEELVGLLDVHTVYNSKLLIFLHLTEWYRVSNTVSESLEFLSLNFGIFQEVCKSSSNLTKRDLVMLTLWRVTL